MTRPLPTLLAAVVALSSLVIPAGCAGDEGTVPATTTTATAAAVDPAVFRAEAEAICVEVGGEIEAASPTAGATPEQAAEAFRAIAAVNRDGVDRLRALAVPTELDADFRAWLDLMDETANKLEAAGLALQVSDQAAFQAAVTDAEATSQQAATAAQSLQLPACVFAG